MEEWTASVPGAARRLPAPHHDRKEKSMAYQAPEFLELGKVENLTHGCERLWSEGVNGRIMCI